MTEFFVQNYLQKKIILETDTMNLIYFSLLKLE